ncbi:MAG: oligoendopeptidase F family protein [Deltaproteobacteria bacterium]|nr:oligoendopeptidase F family protein [Deltaproteobacteria bacterium]
MNHNRTLGALASLAWLAAAGCPGRTGVSNPEPPANPPGTVPDADMDRAQIPPQYLWNLSPLFPDEAAFEEGLAQAATQREELARCRGTLADPDRLEACLDLYFELRLLTYRAGLYANLRQETDIESSEAQARFDRAQAALFDLMGLAASFRGEILAWDDAALTAACESRPKLAGFRPYLDRIRDRRDHVLGDEAEHVLALAGDNQWAEIDLNEIPSDHEKAFKALLAEIPLPELTDENGTSVPLTLSNYGRYRASPERRVREAAVEGLFGALRSFDATFAALLAGQAGFNVFLARSRGYDRALDAYLWRDQVDPAIYVNLIRAVEDNVAPVQRYLRFRKEQMDLDELHIYDLYTPLVPVVERRIPYESAVEQITAALAPLGEDYLAVLGPALDPHNGWIDVFPHRDKRSGAFSASMFGEHPYVFMNYFEDLDDMLTLAHEYGHALHSHLAMQSQPYVTANYTMLIAETASTFNEVLVLRHRIDGAADDDERLYLLGELVETIRTTIYRQALFAAFELEVHTAIEQGTPVTAEFLEQKYLDLLRRFYGDALTLGENDGMEWAYIPHFYYKYYVYSYTGGLLSGIALGERVLAGGEAERDAYLDMLRSGSSKPPLELLRGAGVDPSDPAVVEAAARLLDDSLSRMEEILARRLP